MFRCSHTVFRERIFVPAEVTLVKVANYREERTPTRCNNIDDLLSIVDVDYRQQSRHVSGIFMPIVRRKDHVLLQIECICW